MEPQDLQDAEPELPPLAPLARARMAACPELPEGVLSEIFDEDVYRLRTTPVEARAVIDLGANVGAFSLAAAEMGAAWILAIEPEPTNYETLKRCTGQAPVHPACLAAWRETRVLSITSEGGGSKTKPGIQLGVNDVMAYSLKWIMDILQDHDIALLKIDIEGAEREVFAAPDISEALQRCEFIAMEFHENTLAVVVPAISRTHSMEIIGSDERGGYLYARRYGSGEPLQA